MKSRKSMKTTGSPQWKIGPKIGPYRALYREGYNRGYGGVRGGVGWGGGVISVDGPLVANSKSPFLFCAQDFGP